MLSNFSDAIFHGSNEEAAVRKTVKQYGNATTVHGISYILEQGRHPLERLLWIVLVLTGFGVFFYLTTTICTERENNPVMTTVETTGYNIENIEFPSITVCPQGSVKKITGDPSIIRFIECLLIRMGIY